MIAYLWRGIGFVGLALMLMACADTQTVVGKPTALPSLNVTLWVTYPAVQSRQMQSANLAVYDLQGQPVSNATGVLVVAVGDYEQEYHFPLTNLEGRATVEIEVPPEALGQAVSARVVVVQSGSGQWGEEATDFEVIP